MQRTILLTLALLALTACTPENRSPDAIREETAKATSTAARDAKAVVKGIADGLKEKGPINVNHASASDLQTLPGIDAATADRIIAGRPYKNSVELKQRHLISKAEYDRIVNRIEAR